MKSVYDILLAPVMTEKSMGAGRNGAYTFLVNNSANKFDVKRAVEDVFHVKVSSVNILRRNGKRKIFRGKKGLHADRKFAIIALSEGTINYEGGI